MDIIARGNFGHFRVQLYPKLHEKACNYLLIIYFIKCSLIFQDSYMRSGDMTTFFGLLFRPLDYVHNCMTTFIRAFNVPAVYMKLQIRVKVGINFTQTYEGKCIRYD